MEEILHALGIEPQLIITQLIGFIVLLVLLQKFVFSKIGVILDERQATIKKTYDQLDADRLAMEQSRKEYEQRLAGIEAEAREKIQAAVKEAQTLRDNLVADAQQQAEAIIEKGRSDSESERQKAFLEMRRQIVGLAMTAAGKVIGESLDPARHTALVDDFIGSVGAGSIVEHGRGVSGNAIGSSAQTGTVA
ncbi:MAG: atpF1 [Capsulimonas sp.]|jgi:F-type H+-transporting ATPase subunit b|nr:atpF1 [Capsulimonas sp.]